ncbi:hypothetical protein NBH15_03485 [Parabacteroides sp. W1-Q-101]|uniref:hypothetical protein n=1 Tax=Parabacteroides caeci TaxID=2949650 RepID=UPI0020302893|nr:hypothetical protein [Parabacteroides sp. W1-Q-101]MCM0717334.1 hypothetical protein [Parabacteroides sp. W1-Q-101]
MRTKRIKNNYSAEIIAIDRAEQDLLGAIKKFIPGILFTKKGKVFQAECPFPDAPNDRFYVWPEKRSWFTFGKKTERGGIYSFLYRLKETGKDEIEQQIIKEFGQNSDNEEYVPLYSSHRDVLIFRNKAIVITPNHLGIRYIQDVDFYPKSDKMIDHDIRYENCMFTVSYTEEYLISDDEGFDSLDKFTLSINWDNFSFAQFVYNTGNTYWRGQEQGIELDEKQKKEIAFNFIQKVCVLGYACRKYKDRSKAYLPLVVDDNRNELVTATGKSLFLHAIKQVRNVEYRDGIFFGRGDKSLLFSGIKDGVTDVLLIEDMANIKILKYLYGAITGDMVARDRFKDCRVIPFDESPVIVASTNSYPWNTSESDDRRIWVCSFSDYYHLPLAKGTNREGRSPKDEFGKWLIDDYTEYEMNKFYKFMIDCICTYLFINEKI